jgi:hypothetical protein
MTLLTDARRETLAKMLLGLFLAVTMLVSAAGAAEARRGADDPPGDDRGKVSSGQGEDDRGRDDRGRHHGRGHR